jgi:predicted dehydrogenase
VVGLGAVGARYDLDPRTARHYAYSTHASVYARHRRTELVGLCDPDARRLREASERYPTAHAYHDLAAMLGAEKLDLVSLCVPPEAHEEAARRCIDRGIPLLFCEKPFTPSAEAAQRVIRAARKAGTSILVNYWRRFDLSHQRVGELVRSRAFGGVQGVRAVYGNGLMNTASHVINLLMDYLGPVEWVEAAEGVDDRPGDPSPHLRLGFRQGPRATFVPCSYRHFRILELDLLGTKGRVTVQNEGLDIRYYPVVDNEDLSGERQIARLGKTIPSTVGTALYAGVETALRSLDSGKKTWPDHAVQTHRVLRAARAALARSRRVVLNKRSKV